MKKLLLIYLIIQPLSIIYAQDSASTSNKIFTIVQQMPKYPHLTDYINEHLAYPKEAISKGVEGTVYVTFIVEKDGNLTKIHVLRSLEHSLDSSAIACISSMPKWSPGMQNGQAVRVQFNTQVHFNLPDKDASVANAPSASNKNTSTQPDAKPDKGSGSDQGTNTAPHSNGPGMDTIYMNNDKIACNVKEVTEDAVKYVYPGEETINTVFKNAITKIVFKSGRVSTFAEATSFKKVACIDDYDNVSFSHVQSEVRGLFKMGEVSTKAKGVTVFSDMERVKERAIYKLKVEAAMMGANVVLITQEATSGNVYGRYVSNSTATNMAGVAYSNILPSFNDFQVKANGRTVFNINEESELDNSSMDYEKKPQGGKLTIAKLYNESGMIMINGSVDGGQQDSFRVISFTDTYFIVLVSDENSMYNLKLNF